MLVKYETIDEIKSILDEEKKHIRLLAVLDTLKYFLSELDTSLKMPRTALLFKEPV